MVLPEAYRDSPTEPSADTGAIIDSSSQTGSTVDVSTDTGSTATGEKSMGSIDSGYTGSITPVIESRTQNSGSIESIAQKIQEIEINKPEKESENMTLIKDGDIQVNTGIILEDANKRITIEIASGTTINTVDVDGREIDGNTGQVMIDSALDQTQRADIESDETIAKLGQGSKQTLDTAFEIGPTDRHMMFSRPVRVMMDMDPSLE